ETDEESFEFCEQIVAKMVQLYRLPVDFCYQEINRHWGKRPFHGESLEILDRYHWLPQSWAERFVETDAARRGIDIDWADVRRKAIDLIELVRNGGHSPLSSIDHFIRFLNHLNSDAQQQTEVPKYVCEICVETICDIMLAIVASQYPEELKQQLYQRVMVLRDCIIVRVSNNALFPDRVQIESLTGPENGK
ncbi:MAG: hypothetical protein V4719_09430, partial [Planctomycetota bacterium]